jgi:hypothetical protein
VPEWLHPRRITLVLTLHLRGSHHDEWDGTIATLHDPHERRAVHTTSDIAQFVEELLRRYQLEESR